MSDSHLALGADGRLQVVGVLDYLSGPALREQGRALIKRASIDPLLIDCSAVERSSSVGLSLLLCLMRDAKATGRRIQIVGLPKDMLDIARVSGLDRVLPLATETAG